MVAAIVFAGAPLTPTARLRTRLEAVIERFVIAADSGAATALAFGLLPDLIIGDLDSLDPGTQSELERRQVPFETYPRAKDATDGQLALKRALEAGPSDVLLLGFLNGARLDQQLANALLLTTSTRPTTLLDERNECTLLRGGELRAWRAEPDEVISLLPLGGAALDVRTTNLRYPLVGETLAFGDTRGISNEPAADHVSITFERGLLFVTRHFPNG